MKKVLKKNKIRFQRGKRVDKKTRAVSNRPRLSVYRTNTCISAQIIDDVKGVTLCFASSKGLKTKGTKSDLAKEVGKTIAEKAKEKKIAEIVFDRGRYAYHGRVKALAEGAREGGLSF